MSVGKVVVEVLKSLENKKVEIVEIPKVDGREAIIDTTEGQIVLNAVDQRHVDISLKKDRVFFGVSSCTYEEVNGVMEYIIDHMKLIRSLGKSEKVKTKSQ